MMKDVILAEFLPFYYFHNDSSEFAAPLVGLVQSVFMVWCGGEN